MKQLCLVAVQAFEELSSSLLQTDRDVFDSFAFVLASVGELDERHLASIALGVALGNLRDCSVLFVRDSSRSSTMLMPLESFEFRTAVRVDPARAESLTDTLSIPLKPSDRSIIARRAS